MDFSAHGVLEQIPHGDREKIVCLTIWLFMIVRRNKEQF
jgi:hypothetical protein